MSEANYFSSLVTKSPNTASRTLASNNRGREHRDNAPRQKSAGADGGTAVRGDGVRVFRPFAWLEFGSGKLALSRPAHQPSSPSPGRSAGVLARREPRRKHAG